MKCVYCREQEAVTQIKLLNDEYRYLCAECRAVIDEIRMPLKVLKLERLNANDKVKKLTK